MAAEETNGERKAREYKQYKELIGKGIQPSVALKTIESQRELKPIQSERYQKEYPGRKEFRTIPRTAEEKEVARLGREQGRRDVERGSKGFLGIDWKGAGSKIASNIQTNVAQQTRISLKQPEMGMGFKTPDFGMGFGRPSSKPKGHIVGHDMWGQPIYGKPKKHKGKGKGRDIVIHVR